jgi:hypothetical protein
MTTIKEIENHFNVRWIESKMDIEIIMTNYWEKFNRLFPDVTEETFKSWVNEDFMGGWEESLNYNSAGRRELIILYCCVRAAKPKKILEIGTHQGFSTNHILLAAQKNKAEGYECQIDTIDITNYSESPNSQIYPYNKIIGDSIEYIKFNQDYDFIVQDGCHDSTHVSTELVYFEDFKKLKTIWSHDYYLNNNEVGNAINKSNFIKKLNNFNEFKEENYIAGFFVGVI